jgi:hypothetical protein
MPPDKGSSRGRGIDELGFVEYARLDCIGTILRDKYGNMSTVEESILFKKSNGEHLSTELCRLYECKS